MDVWLKLTGPNDKGLAPKGCTTRDWNLPSYTGVDLAYVNNGVWYGLRLDEWVVIDCDSLEAANAWLNHIGQHDKHTLVRQTPHGYHFFYKRPAVRVDSRKLPTIHPLMEVKTGVGHQVVFFAPGYETEVGTGAGMAMMFDPSWLPEVERGNKGIEEWSEMPDGIGDNAMISFAGKFREWGMDQATILECLNKINRLTMTREPMPIRSLRRIARQAAKYETAEHEPETIQCASCGAEMEIR